MAKEIALTGQFSKTGKPGGPLIKGSRDATDRSRMHRALDAVLDRARGRDSNIHETPHKFEPMPGNKKPTLCNRCLNPRSHWTHQKTAGKDVSNKAPKGAYENTSPCYTSKPGSDQVVRGEHRWSGDYGQVNAHCEKCGELRYLPK
jgi:hypothetical protein